MKDVRECPENLSARATQGADSAHLRECSSCREELAVAQAFKREFVDYAGIEELSRRVAAATSAELARAKAATAPRRQRLRTGWYLLAAALILMSIAAFAATYRTLPIPWHASQLSPVDRAAPPVAPSVSPSGQGIATRTDEVPVDPPANKGVAAPSAESAPLDAPVAHRAAPTARDLFASANMARHDDHGSRASALYRELQRRYPTSDEALVSRVSFGRLLLDRLGDPSGALAQFDGYLAQTAHTALAEEALFGRASALSQLGRSDAERETWRTLLARYPSSVYADRARVRIGSIQ
jgi:hypothetical protein